MVREAALCRVTDQALLARIRDHDPIREVRAADVKRLQELKNSSIEQ